MSEVLLFLIFIVLLVMAYYWNKHETEKRLARIRKPKIRKKTKVDYYGKKLSRPRPR